MLKPNASAFCPPPTQPADWARHEFAGAQLPDQRLNERLCMIATAFAQQPTASIPQACGPGAGSKGAYRFFENERIAPHTIRQAHHRATLARVRSQAVVLAIQDTTALNYSTHPQTQGLGPLGSHSEKTIGLLLHSTLAVTPTGRPLGLLHTAVRARDPKARGVARQRHRKPVAQKESQKWLDSLSACQALAAECPDTLLVNLTDREGDLYDLFAQALTLTLTGGPRVHVLVRSRHNSKAASCVCGTPWAERRWPDSSKYGWVAAANNRPDWPPCRSALAQRPWLPQGARPANRRSRCGPSKPERCDRPKESRPSCGDC